MCTFQKKSSRILIDKEMFFCKYRILNECLLISSLPGKASRKLGESRGLLSDSTCILEAEPGKLDIKRGEPGILSISLSVVSLFKLAIMTFLSTFMSIQRHLRRHSKSATSLWPDKGSCREIDIVYQATCTNAVNISSPLG